MTPPVPALISLPYKLERAGPRFGEDEIRYPESLVRYFLKNFTKKGDKVFDPFAGLGTTLFVAEELGRVPYGVEADGNRHAWTAGQMDNWLNLVHGDSAHLAGFGFPKMDFCMTSPPFMPRGDKWNPLFAGDPKHAGYDAYLKQMTRIFKNLPSVMKKNAVVVVQVDNVQKGKVFTPLVRDLSLAISKTLRPEGEIIVTWTGGKPGYRHTHCLLFKNAG